MVFKKKTESSIFLFLFHFPQTMRTVEKHNRTSIEVVWKVGTWTVYVAVYVTIVFDHLLDAPGSQLLLVIS